MEAITAIFEQAFVSECEWQRYRNQDLSGAIHLCALKKHEKYNFELFP